MVRSSGGTHEHLHGEEKDEGGQCASRKRREPGRAPTPASQQSAIRHDMPHLPANFGAHGLGKGGWELFRWAATHAGAAGISGGDARRRRPKEEEQARCELAAHGGGGTRKSSHWLFSVFVMSHTMGHNFLLSTKSQKKNSRPSYPQTRDTQPKVNFSGPTKKLR